jgi:hypothetical protein
VSRFERALRFVAARSAGPPIDPAHRVTLNFHPDRGDLLDSLAHGGRYVSQFVTGTSNGGLTAFPGGDRWRWESRMFGGAYDDAPAADRPVYGALNLHRSVVGAAPRFGSAHLRLTADCLHRATFCYPDSFLEPTDFGVATNMRLADLAAGWDGDPLDGYVEAHVHGPVRIDSDVEAIVLDPCYRGTAVESAAARLPCAVEWHPGFRLSVDDLRRHPEYRGPEFVALGVSIAVEGRLDPAVIGAAAATGRYDLQSLKRVWHYVARFGCPVRD